VDLSEKVPVALNCCAVPRAMLVLAGVTAMDTSVAVVLAAALLLCGPLPHCINAADIKTDRDSASTIFIPLFIKYSPLFFIVPSKRQGY